MLFHKPEQTRPLFMWMMLVASTALLVLVVAHYVYRGGSSSSSSAPSPTEKSYAAEVHAQVQTYIDATAKLNPNHDDDRATWKKLAQQLQNQLLSTLVPARMQTVHLSLVLQLNQAISALDAQNGAVLASHRDQMKSIISALPYE